MRLDFRCLSSVSYPDSHGSHCPSWSMPISGLCPSVAYAHRGHVHQWLMLWTFSNLLMSIQAFLSLGACTLVGQICSKNSHCEAGMTNSGHPSCQQFPHHADVRDCPRACLLLSSCGPGSFSGQNPAAPVNPPVLPPGLDSACHPG